MELGAFALLSLLRAVMSAAAAPSADLPTDDEFRIDSLSPEAPEEMKEPEEVQPDGKVTLAGLFSLQWAEQELRLGVVEYLALGTIMLYLAVYLRGRRRNYEIAHTFIKGVHGLFCTRFL